MKTKGGEEEGLDEPIVEINNLQTCRGTQYQKYCGDCVKARGIRRAHRKGAMVHKWNLSAGLSGPHPKSVGTEFTYLLVGVVTLDSSGQRLPFVKGLCSKRGEETGTKLEEILLGVRPTTG